MEGKHPTKPFDLKGRETLPSELLQKSLIELDATSIKSAVLSGAAFYRAFKSGESHVVRQFVRHNVPVNLFHDAVVVFRAIGAHLGRMKILKHYFPSTSSWILDPRIFGVGHMSAKKDRCREQS